MAVDINVRILPRLRYDAKALGDGMSIASRRNASNWQPQARQLYVFSTFAAEQSEGLQVRSKNNRRSITSPNRRWPTQSYIIANSMFLHTDFPNLKIRGSYPKARNGIPYIAHCRLFRQYFGSEGEALVGNVVGLGLICHRIWRAALSRVEHRHSFLHDMRVILRGSHAA